MAVKTGTVVCQLQTPGLHVPKVVFAVSKQADGYHVTKYVQGHEIWDFGPYNDYDHAMDGLTIPRIHNPSYEFKYFL